MKDLGLLVWLTQLGLSVAFPLAGFVLLGLWLHRSVGWGSWTVWCGIVVGLICAITGFRDCLKAMDKLSRNKKHDKNTSVNFNDHL